MPLFFGFYSLLSKVIELKGQPFLHLHDLTAADPYYIMPILSGTFMFISSWMSSKTVADQGQRMMLMISPLLFAFFFLYYPAGLSLYWAVSNLFTIGQQRLINHYGDKKVAEEHGREKLRAELAGEPD
jgi:YidC/Oxa1 family membrane protein insertase